MSKQPLKTYRVPVIHHVAFGCEVEVQARSLAQAKRLAVQASAEVSGGDGYDWDRMNFERAELGDWDPIQIVEEDSRNTCVVGLRDLTDEEAAT